MDVLTAQRPTTTRKTSPAPFRPRQWPCHDDATARRRYAGHQRAVTPAPAPPAPPPPELSDAAPTSRPRRAVGRSHTTTLDRARLALVAAMFAAATASATLPTHSRTVASQVDPHRPGAASSATPAVACSPIEATCCASDAGGPAALLRSLRPTCP